MDHSDDLSSIEGLGRLYRRRVDARNVSAAGCVAPEAMLALLEREGPESQRLATLEHVMSCPDCHREYEWLAAVGQAATEASGRPARQTLWRRAPLALAASLVAAVAAGLLVRGQMRGGEPVRGETGDIALAAPAVGPGSTGSTVFSWAPCAGCIGLRTRDIEGRLSPGHSQRHHGGHHLHPADHAPCRRVPLVGARGHRWGRAPQAPPFAR